MKKIVRVAGLFLILAGLAGVMRGAAARADVYENITYREKRGKSVVIQDVYKSGSVMFLPQSIEGKPVIGWRLDKPYKKVKQLILPRYFRVESKYFSFYRSNNPLHFFPNLESLEFSVESKYLQIYGGGLYSKDLTKLYAVLPYATELRLPKETNEITSDALETGKKIRNIRVEKGNSSYRASHNILYSRDGKELLWASPKGIPSVCVVASGVERIREEAFEGNKKLRELRLPEGVDVIEESAFSDCINLKKIKFGKNLRRIDEYAFENCKSLRELRLPEGLDELEEDAFYRCRSIQTLSIPESIYIWNYVPRQSLRRLEIHGGLVDEFVEDYAESCMGTGKNLTIYAQKGTNFWKHAEEKKNKDKNKNVQLKPLSGKAEPQRQKDVTGRLDDSWYKKEAKKLKISTPAQLASFLEKGSSYAFDTSKKQIVLTRDIDMKGYRGLWGLYEFAGELDGKGHHIRNLRIYQPTMGDIALIRELNGKGVVKNLNVHGNITGGRWVGGIVGTLTDEATVENCHFYGKVKGLSIVGGIAGGVYLSELATVRECVNHGKVSANYFAGGILGNFRVKLTQVWKNKNRGSVKAIRFQHKLYSLGERFRWDDDWWDDWWDY